MTIHVFPSFIVFRGIPYDLWVWTYKDIISPSFKFFTT